MQPRKPHPVSDDDDDLFFPHSSSLAAPGLVHLQNPAYYRNLTNDSVSSDNDESCTPNLRPRPRCYSSFESFDSAQDISPHCHSPQPSVGDQLSKQRIMRQGSIVDGLLHEIYDRWHYGRSDSIDSDTLTECSSTSDFFFHSRHESGGYHSAVEKRHAGQLNKSFLQNQSHSQLKRMLSDLQRSIAVMNVRLVKQLKRRDRRLAKLQRNFDIVTAVLQAASLKRQIDTRMKFSIQPPPGQSAFDQWRDAMKAVCRLPMGIPPEFRKKVWLSLADHYLFQLKINWETTVRFVFNERSNPDDEQLGMQIVKDLHRTGCSNFSGDENDEDRAVLKRLLLAYARWNKRVGYCQGFNVIAALLLNVMDRKEDDALKVMIYLIDSVLPESYFANNLRALSVDMAVFRDLLRLTYPRLSKHLDRLQLAAQDIRTGACYEPPLTNVFTMQWFLTLFATCLPVNIVLRVWDSILLEGSEILLRTALTIWGKLAKRIMGVSSADEFYCLMGELSSSVMQGSIFDGDTMVKSIYSLGDFPFPHLNDLREKYTYNIRPFTPASNGSGSKKNGGRSAFKSLFNSDEDEPDDDDIAAMACFPDDVNSSSDISVLGPGVYGPGMEEGASKGTPQMERMTTDISSLKLQYQRLKQRQQQAHIIIAAASAKKTRPSATQRLGTPGVPAAALVPKIESPTAMNHLFVGKTSTSTRNRFITDGPRISAPAHLRRNTGVLAKQLQAVANAQAVSKSKRMRTGVSGKGVAGATTTDTKSGSEPDDCSSPAVTQELKSDCTSDTVTRMEMKPSGTGEDGCKETPACDVSESLTCSVSSPSKEDQLNSSSEQSISTEAVALVDSSTSASLESKSQVLEQQAIANNQNELGEDVTSKDGCNAKAEIVSPETHNSIASKYVKESVDLSTSSNLDPLMDSNQEKLEHSHSDKILKEIDDQNSEAPTTEIKSQTNHAVIKADGSKSDLSIHKLSDEVEALTTDTVDVEFTSDSFRDKDSNLRLSEDNTGTSNEKSLSEETSLQGRSSSSLSGTDNEIYGCVTSAENIDVRDSSERLQQLAVFQSKRLVTPENPLEDSGVDSPSANSPMPTLGRQQCLQEEISSKNSFIGEEMVLSVERDVASNTNQNVESPAIKITMRLENDSKTDDFDSRSPISEYDGEEFPSHEVTNMPSGPTEIHEPKESLIVGKNEIEDSTRRSSSSSSGSVFDGPTSHSDMVMTSPINRSSSVIETIPVPETVDVRNEEETDVPSGIIVHKIKRHSSSASEDKMRNKEKVVKPGKPIVWDLGQQSLIVGHKPAGTTGSSKHSRRYSSPVKSDLQDTENGMASQPSIGRKLSTPFSPFPKKQLNANRVKTGLKLGLYSASTLEQLKGLKSRNTSS